MNLYVSTKSFIQISRRSKMLKSLKRRTLFFNQRLVPRTSQPIRVSDPISGNLVCLRPSFQYTRRYLSLPKTALLHQRRIVLATSSLLLFAHCRSVKQYLLIRAINGDPRITTAFESIENVVHSVGLSERRIIIAPSIN